MARHERPFERRPTDQCQPDADSGEVRPVARILPKSDHPFQNQSLKRGIGRHKPECLFSMEIRDALIVIEWGEGYRIDFDIVALPEAISRGPPLEALLIPPPPARRGTRRHPSTAWR